jgi:hypothetical protein
MGDDLQKRLLEVHEQYRDTYYLIHLGRDIVKCPGGRERAELHLKQIRRDVIEEHRQATAVRRGVIADLLLSYAGW